MQTTIEHVGNPVEQILALVTSEAFLDNKVKAKDGNKAAKRRLRAQLLVLKNLAHEARKELSLPPASDSMPW